MWFADLMMMRQLLSMGAAAAAVGGGGAIEHALKSALSALGDCNCKWKGESGRRRERDRRQLKCGP